jgi:hypothetical protein
MSKDWIKVPVGPEAAHWATRRQRRDVLAVVHNVTSLTRLLDVVSLFESDFRVQVVFTWTRSSPFAHDVEGFLAEIGAIVAPWEQALAMEFDLAITTSYGGELADIKAPLIALSHGMGYNKYLKTKNQKPKTRNPVFGLSREWLLSDGRLVPSTIVLSHDEQLERLRNACPEAVPAAVLAGDPCFDRMLASVPHRHRYRAAFALTPDTRLVVLSSTWGPGSLLSSHGDLPRRLLAELPMDAYRVAAILHPNIWHGHSPWQVRTWLADCLRAGLILLPPREGWRAALVAADLVIGDHGSVTFYGTALGRPTLLGAFPRDRVAPDSPVGRLGRAVPRLAPDRPLLSQVERAIANASRYESITGQTTSAPGRSAALLRTELYRLLALPEPAAPPTVTRVPEPEVAPEPVTATLVSASWTGGTVRVVRHPAAVALADPSPGTHLVADECEPEERLLELGDIVFCHGDDRLAETLARYPGCDLVAAEHTPGETLVLRRDGTRLRLSGAEAGVHASIVYAWLAAGRRPAELPPECELLIGAARHPVSLKIDR